MRICCTNQENVLPLYPKSMLIWNSKNHFQLKENNMGRQKKEIKAKEPIRIRERKLANGNISLYLDVYQKVFVNTSLLDCILYLRRVHAREY